MQFALAQLDASVIEEVSLVLWKELFDAVGWPASLVGKRDTFNHADILQAFNSDTPTDELLQALEALEDLGTETGRDAIVSAMNDCSVSLATLPTSTGEREFALRLFLAQRSDVSMADVYARAQTQTQEGADHRRYNEFLGKAAKPVSNLKKRSDALRLDVLGHCRENGLGEHVDVRAFENNGTYFFHVIRSHHMKTPLAVVPGHDARTKIHFRPVHGDILRYDSFTGRLRIAARVASIVEFYRRSLGRILFNDGEFFSGEPLCNLRVLQDRGRSALENHDIANIGRVWMTECIWERGDRNLLHIRSADCFRAIEELKLPLLEGELIQAKLKLEVIGKSTRPVTVTIRVPSRIEISQKTHEHLVDQFLSRVGIRNLSPGLTRTDLWSLHPGRQPMSVWRSLFGRDTDLLVEQRVLLPIQLASVPHPDHAGAGRVLEAQAMPGGDFYGVSQAAEIPSRSLSPTDLDGWELDPERFRTHLRTKLGISVGGTAWDGQDLLDLGAIELGAQRLHIAYALRQPIKGFGDRLRAKAAGVPPVLLIPSSQYEGSELPKVILDSPLPQRSQVIRSAIAASGLGDSLPALYSADDGVRLVVDTRHGKVWVDQVEITELRCGTHPFNFVTLLARARGGPVALEKISEELSSGRQDGTSAARQAKGEAKRIICDAMAAAGRTFTEDPFPSAGTGYYRCLLPSYALIP